MFLTSWKCVLRVDVKILNFLPFILLCLKYSMLCLLKWMEIICTFLLWNAWISYFRGYVFRKTIFHLLKSCVLQRKKFILVSFLHSESLFSCKRQSCTVFLSWWKWVSLVIASCRLNHYVWSCHCCSYSNESKYLQVCLVKRVTIIFQGLCV